LQSDNNAEDSRLFRKAGEARLTPALRKRARTEFTLR
jgi:hypothetical protein